VLAARQAAGRELDVPAAGDGDALVDGRAAERRPGEVSAGRSPRAEHRDEQRGRKAAKAPGEEGGSADRQNEPERGERHRTAEVVRDHAAGDPDTQHDEPTGRNDREQANAERQRSHHGADLERRRLFQSSA
jgi:hypothetical protein